MHLSNKTAAEENAQAMFSTGVQNMASQPNEVTCSRTFQVHAGQAVPDARTGPIHFFILIVANLFVV